MEPTEIKINVNDYKKAKAVAELCDLSVEALAEVAFNSVINRSVHVITDVHRDLHLGHLKE